MLRATLCRRLTSLSSMTKGATCVQRTVFTGRPPSSHPSDTVDDDVAKVTGSSLNRAPDAPSEDHRSSKDVLDLDKKSSFDLEALRIRFRQLSDRSAAAVRRRADDFTAKTASTFSQLGSHLNRVTGYEEIEVLKRRVVEQEGRIAMTRQAAREAKTAYDEAVLRRSNAQREINDLLQRPKSTWSESDVIRFTTLFQQDHLHEQPEEVRAKAAAADADEAVDREFSQLMRTILARYHEEQVWSDKIRSASTYGSLAALALNMVVFILAIIIVEPWKRRRLAQTFEKKIEEMSAENTAMVKGGMKDLARHFVEQETLLSQMIKTTSNPSSSQMPESTTEVPTRVVERIVMVAKDKEMATAFAASIVMAGAIGWIARSWLGL